MSIETTTKLGVIGQEVFNIIHALPEDRKNELEKVVCEARIFGYTKLIDFLGDEFSFDVWFEMFKVTNLDNVLFKEPEFQPVKEMIIDIFKLDKAEFMHYYENEAISDLPKDPEGKKLLAESLQVKVNTSKAFLDSLK